MSFINLNLIDRNNLSLFEEKKTSNDTPRSYYINHSMPPLFSFSTYNCFNYYPNFYTFNPFVFNNFYMPLYTFSNTYLNTLNIFTQLYNMASQKHSTVSVPRTNPTRRTQNTISWTTPSTPTRSTLSLSDVGYNAEKGNKLAQTVRKNIIGFNNQCAKYVRIALEQSGLGNGSRGDGYQYADILSNNKNFKEISTKNLNLSNLPAGCILVYDRGVSGYSGEYGHVEITLGNGQAASDGVTNNIRPGARVFVPV